MVMVDSRPLLGGIIIYLRFVLQVGLQGFTQDSRYLYFLMQYIPGGELFTYLRTEGKLSQEHAM